MRAGLRHLSIMTKSYTSVARQTWTDERLDERFDHLETEMDERFKRVEAEMKTALHEEIARCEAGLRGEIREGNAELVARSVLRGEIGSLSAQLAALSQTLIRVGFGFAAALLAGVLFHLL